MVEDALNNNWQPVVLEVGMYESIALLLEAIKSPLSSPVAWFGAAIAVIRFAVLLLKSYDDYNMRKMKKELMQEEIEAFKLIRSGKRVADMTDEEMMHEKNKLINEAKLKDEQNI